MPDSLLANLQRKNTVSVLVVGMILSLGSISVHRAGLETIVLFVNLLAGTAYTVLPLLVFLGWWEVAVALSLKVLWLSTFTLSRIILIVLQAWSPAMLARTVSVVKGLRLDKTAIISLGPHT